jgi:1,4-alpha-glucan branching enzyme
VHDLVRDLNRVQAAHPALYAWDCDGRGFEWLNGDDDVQSVIAFARHGGQETLTAVFNFTPVPRYDYRIPVTQTGTYEELFNSDAGVYGGSELRNGGPLHSEAVPFRGREHSLRLTLPPLAAVLLRRI